MLPNCIHIVQNFQINPSQVTPGRRDKINLNFYFRTYCGTLKGFMKALKAFLKPSGAPQKSVKTKI